MTGDMHAAPGLLPGDLPDAAIRGHRGSDG
jgi:hypothetical protein